MHRSTYPIGSVQDKVEKEVARSGVRILPSNRDFLNRKCGGVRGEQLAMELERRGFLHLSTEVVDPGIMVEVYPFGILYGITRGKPPRYKHGGIEQRREGCLSVLEAMGRWEPSLKGLEWMEGQIERADSQAHEAHGRHGGLDALCNVPVRPLVISRSEDSPVR